MRKCLGCPKCYKNWMDSRKHWVEPSVPFSNWCLRWRFILVAHCNSRVFLLPYVCDRGKGGRGGTCAISVRVTTTEYINRWLFIAVGLHSEPSSNGIPLWRVAFMAGRSGTGLRVWVFHTHTMRCSTKSMRSIPGPLAPRRLTRTASSFSLVLVAE